ncbi:hypothetical protein ATHEMM101B_01390 [Atlantibacter hermannii]
MTQTLFVHRAHTLLFSIKYIHDDVVTPAVQIANKQNQCEHRIPNARTFYIIVGGMWERVNQTGKNNPSLATGSCRDQAKRITQASDFSS